ncbi:hypothetical protein P3W55_13750 [Pseudomonas citronellolis]|uniref:DUF7666 domain-containing protein n=1 Tax=Pseudomonas citronellolis TaxID=53408 RepID=A0AAW6P6B7_9PSED|nr:hypothetical protein [Pseudomonas citronellolis]MDF3842776.1 hypothetical protein [Pseudomonas citronellolis]
MPNRAPAKEEVVTSFKGFNQDLTCRGYQFEIGKTYEHKGEVEACASGFHACEYPLDTFGYYRPAGSRFALVEQSGDLSRHDDDSKVASRKISIKAELTIAGLVKAAIEYTTSRCTPVDPESPASSTGDYGAASSTGNRGAASSTGDYGAASSTGNRGAASSTGDYGAASSTGDYGAASSTGYQGTASSTGDYGAASSTGNRGAASSTGDYGAASSTGNRGAASSTGNRGAASSTGNRGAASSTGDYGAASSTGNRGAASSTGYQGTASSTGRHSVALAAGIEGKARASAGSAIVLCYRDTDAGGDDYARIVHIKAAIAGQDGIKPDVFYVLNKNGEFVECD